VRGKGRALQGGGCRQERNPERTRHGQGRRSVAGVVLTGQRQAQHHRLLVDRQANQRARGAGWDEFHDPHKGLRRATREAETPFAGLGQIGHLGFKAGFVDG
jgi:hypothetical protein